MKKPKGQEKKKKKGQSSQPVLQLRVGWDFGRKKIEDIWEKKGGNEKGSPPKKRPHKGPHELWGTAASLRTQVTLQLRRPRKEEGPGASEEDLQRSKIASDGRSLAAGGGER